MRSDVFVPGEEHRDEIVRLMRVAYNSGFLNASDAVALGLVEREMARALAAVFGGPAPWMYDFF